MSIIDYTNSNTKKWIVIIIILSFIFSISLYFYDHFEPKHNDDNNSDKKSPYNAPISIIDNSILLTNYSDFELNRDGNSWETAIIISNLNIYITEDKDAFSIQDTSLFLIISNCTFNRESSWISRNSVGLSIYNCANIRIKNCNITNFRYGIECKYSNNIFAQDSNIILNENGVYTYSNNNFNLTRCLISNCSNNGLGISNNFYSEFKNNTFEFCKDELYLYDSKHCNFSLNSFEKKGIKFISQSFFGINKNISLDDTNTISGLPIYYYENVSNVIINFNDEIGQLILNNCDNNKFSSGKISYRSDAISMISCSNNSLSGFEIYNTTRYAIVSIFSDSNLFFNNYIHDNRDNGMFIYNSDKITIYNNTFVRNEVDINNQGADYCNITSNVIQNIYNYDSHYNLNYAIYSDFSNNSIIKNNTITSTIDYGVYLRDSDNYAIENNTFYGSAYSLYFNSAENNTFKYNNFYNTKFAPDILNNSIDFTNLYNGKPIYCYYNLKNKIIDSNNNIGLIRISNCENITIKNKVFTNELYPMSIYYSNSCIISNVSLISPEIGIRIRNCINITVLNCDVKNSTFTSLLLEKTNNSTVLLSDLSSFDLGIKISEAFGNVISFNNITGNETSFYIYNSYNNSIQNNTLSYLIPNSECFIIQNNLENQIENIFYGNECKRIEETEKTIFNRNYLDFNSIVILVISLSVILIAVMTTLYYWLNKSKETKRNDKRTNKREIYDHQLKE